MDDLCLQYINAVRQVLAGACDLVQGLCMNHALKRSFAIANIQSFFASITRFLHFIFVLFMLLIFLLRSNIRSLNDF